ncbi:ABC transporter permease [Bacillus spizizenii]|nr:ABC transporter permease [Bacillus spizizenii]MCY7959946.1 ABC transporter permease [Bacillus spizizenii]MCY7988223.1 ABC transporter permease [Bacillus spizizenii]MCY7997233.1 ABC transporter permease [Bacillus spizizenii]MCY8051681.1 ABC transporter permease [Bacillus spizizenii]
MLEHIRISFQSIFSHKLRSILTMLGVIIGIAAIIAIVSMLKGQSEQLKQSMIGMGNNAINVVYQPSGGEEEGGGYQVSYTSAPPVAEETVKAIKSDPTVKGLSLYYLSEGASVFHLTNVSYPQVYGVDGDYFDMFPIRITEGRKLAENELNSTHQVVMINEAARDELFPDGDALHRNIEMNGVPFKVAGVFKEKDQQESMFEGDYANPVLYVPKKVWPLIEGFDAPTQIAVQADSSEHIQEAGVMAADLLNQGLSEAELEKAEYSVMDLQEIAQEVESFNQSFALLLGGIASISLLVGGIGVMNIMLVSVTERTREIGIKKALGAKRRVILFQFLTEAVVLTSIGGILGVLAGFGIAKLLTVVFPMPFIVSVPAVVGALIFSMAVGIIFGLLPSIKASKLQPVDALRYE